MANVIGEKTGGNLHKMALHGCVVNCLRQFHLQVLLRRLKLTLRYRQMVRDKLPKIRILITKRWQCQINITKLVVRSQTDHCTCVTD